MKNKLMLFIFWAVFGLTALFFVTLVVVTMAMAWSSSGVSPVSGKEIFFAVKLTLASAFIASTTAVLVSVPVAYVLSRCEFPLKKLFEALLFLPVVMPPIALGAMLLMFFKTPFGDFFERHFFGVVYEVPGVVFAQSIVVFGIAVNVIKVFFDSIPRNFEDVARTLGAARMQAFFRVLLPVSRKGLLSAFLLSFARASGEFGATVTLAGATTMKTETLPVAIYLNFSSADVRGACIFSLVSLVVSVGALLFIKKYAES